MKICLFLAAMVCLAGCGDSDFRPEQVPAKADIQKEIDRVTASTTIPDAAKPGIINGLKKKMEHAK